MTSETDSGVPGPPAPSSQGSGGYHAHLSHRAPQEVVGGVPNWLGEKEAAGGGGRMEDGQERVLAPPWLQARELLLLCTSLSPSEHSFLFHQRDTEPPPHL